MNPDCSIYSSKSYISCCSLLYAINNNSANQVTITGGTIKASNAINNNKEGNINILGTSNITGVVCNYNEGTIDLCGDDINVSYVQNKSSGIINQSAGTVERIEILSQNGSSNITGGLTKYISNAGTIKAINSTITSVSNSKDIDIIDSNISNVNNTGSMKITNCDVNTTNVAVTNLGSITIKNSNITTKGYYIAGDNGAAKYKIMTYDNWYNNILPKDILYIKKGNTFVKTPVDEYGNHTLNNKLIAVIQGDNYTPEQLGAKGD